MKLFGGTGKRLHSQKKTDKPDKPKTAAYNIRQLSHAPIWRKLRVPAIIVSSVLILLLLCVLAYSIWERPPEIREKDGPRIQPTVQPAAVSPDAARESVKPEILPVQTAAPTEDPLADSTPEPTEAPVTNGRKESCYTFVLLAYDQIMANTDTILVGRLDTEAGTLDLVSIPRDTLVNVDWGVKRVNTILPLERNDPGRFLEHLGNLIGFTPDCYAVVNIRAVEKLVDCIGGVYYNVRRDMDYDDPSQDLYIHISKGYQLLCGEDAAKVLRFRVGNDNTGYPDGDLGRIKTQQDFLKSIASQFLTLGNIPNLNQAIQVFQDNVTTDMTANNLAFFAREFLKLDPENIRFHTLPAKSVSIRGGFYLEVQIDEWVGIVNDYLNPFHQEITADNLNILQSAGKEGAVSTTGEILPIDSFLDFNQYMKDLQSQEKNAS